MTSTEVARAAPGAVQAWDRESIDLVKRTIAKGATDDELALFMRVVQRSGLDPFSRQVYAIKRYDSRERRDVMAIQTGIDGFRLIAERTGNYAGQVGPWWCGEDEVWKDVWLSTVLPRAARVGVLKRGDAEVTYAVAHFDEYASKWPDGSLMGQWKTMPRLMIAKCAEALALRKAFPQELSMIYTDDEMSRADRPAPRPDPLVPPEPTPLSADRVASFLAACKEVDVNPYPIVMEATNGRSGDPHDVLTTELPVLSAAFIRARDAKPASDIDGGDSTTDVASDKPGNDISADVTPEPLSADESERRAQSRAQYPAGSPRNPHGADGEPAEFIARRPATRAQVGRIKAEYDRLGLGDTRDSQLVITRNVLGHQDIASHNDVSFDQAQYLLDVLVAAATTDDIKF